MSLKSAIATLAAALTFAGGASSASAQATVETYNNFRWADVSPAICLGDARIAVNGAIATFGLGGMVTGEDTWYVETGAEDLNLWVYCIADDDTPDVDGPAAKRVLIVINVNTSRPNVGADIRDYLAECMEFGCPVRATVATTERITWGENASRLRGNNGTRYSFICPALGDATPAAVWGAGTYTDNSAICAAGVHAGAISTAGGLVTIEIAAGQASYQGMVRNGIATNPWGAFLGSFRVITP